MIDTLTATARTPADFETERRGELTARQNCLKYLGFLVAVELVCQLDRIGKLLAPAVSANISLQYVIGMLCTYLLWGGGYVLLRRWAPAEEQAEKKTPNNYALYIVIFLLVLILELIAWGGFKPYKELIGNIRVAGAMPGILAFLMQYIYYYLEAMLIVLMLRFGQAAGAYYFKSSVPVGAVLLAVFRGLPHILGHGLVDGLLSTMNGLLYGVAYMGIRYEKKLVIPLMALLFMI